MLKSYADLIVWQRAMQLVEAVYRLARSLPDSERFGLSSQLKRSAISIPSNIAEGYERRSRKDYRRFVTIACGSLAELETQLLLSVRLGLADRSSTQACLAVSDEVGRMLRAIERALRESSGLGEAASSYELQNDSMDGGAARFSLSPQPSPLSPSP